MPCVRAGNAEAFELHDEMLPNAYNSQGLNYIMFNYRGRQPPSRRHAARRAAVRVVCAAEAPRAQGSGAHASQSSAAARSSASWCEAAAAPHAPI